ncbi:hypothetical protein ABZ656_33815 [Streptomyces sp. NPDC007095]|uniref:hypothetical protein n=1 Tax=Streptomyces sp. NPDC007095 TaxID=3154482 RepID=UPI0033DCF339
MICTICEQPIEDGEAYKRHGRSGPTGGMLPTSYTHNRCRRRPSIVPFIASWSSEIAADDPAVICRPFLDGIGYSGEIASDRDERGVLWLRRRESRKVGDPLYGAVHSGRQRRAMAELLCQVCGEPADQDDRGVLWMLENNREDWQGWPEDLLTTHPPACLGCLRKAREECPHMWAGSVAVRVGKSAVCAVYGRRYTLGRLGPLVAAADVVALTSPLIGWTVASQLVRSLSDCTIVSLDEELAAAHP